MLSKPDLDEQPKLEKTLALIKPDAYSNGKKDEILNLIEKDGFKIIKQSEIRMSLFQAREFYKEHDGKPFYETLTTWMCRFGYIFKIAV
jgi:nucleoside diphosphate kinase